MIFVKALSINDFSKIASCKAYLRSLAFVTELFSERNEEPDPARFHHPHSFVSF